MSDDYWFDDSEQVPCTEPHTTQTAQVVQLSEPTVAAAKKEADDLCWDYARTYIGLDPQNWVPWGTTCSSRAVNRSPTVPRGSVAT